MDQMSKVTHIVAIDPVFDEEDAEPKSKQKR